MNPHRASFSRQPLAQLAVVFCIGICLGSYLPARLIPWLIAGGVCSLVAVGGVVYRRLQVAGVALLVATACAGAALAVQASRAEQHTELSDFRGRQVVITGVISGPVDVGRDRMYLTLDVERLDGDGSLGVGGAPRSVLGVVSLVVPLGSESEVSRLEL